MPYDIPLKQFIAHPQRLQRAPSKVDDPLPVILPVIRPPKRSSTGRWKYFNYKPLPTPTSIRILRLEIPINFREADIYKPPIRASLVVSDLRDSPEYLALSYTWGDPLTIFESSSQVSNPEDWSAPAFEIICDDQSVSVATNLYTALLSLRCRWKYGEISLSEWLTLSISSTGNKRQPRLKDCLIWVDALCINQQDLSERNEQVKLMNRVYSQAYSVCAWLGGEDFYSQTAAEVIKRIGVDRSEEFIETRWQELQLYDIRDSYAYKKLGFKYTSVDEWLKFYAFINRSWFKRAWIVQEIFLAPKIFVLCGLWNMNISALFNAISFLSGSGWLHHIKSYAEDRTKGYSELGLKINKIDGLEGLSLYRPQPLPAYNQNIFIGVVSMHVHVTEGGSQNDFHQLGIVLQQYRGTLASDPRDKVYAFLGIAKEFQRNIKPSTHPQLTPDYTKSTTDVYIETMKYILSSNENLLFLGLKEPRTDAPTDELPSWVPDFRVWSAPDMFALPGDEPWAAFRTVKRRRFKFIGKRSLKFTGQQLYRVVKVASKTFRVQDIQDTLPILAHLPEQSEIKDPIFNVHMLQFHNVPHREQVADVKQVRKRLHQLRETYTGKMSFQSRYEVLWRTLLFNKWSSWRFGGLPRSYPASDELGKLLECQIIEAIYKQQALVAIAFLHHSNFPWVDTLVEKGILNDKNTLPASEKKAKLSSFKNKMGASLLAFKWEDNLNELRKMITAWDKLNDEMAWDDDKLVLPPKLVHFLSVMLAEDSSNELRYQVASDFLLESIPANVLPHDNASDLSQMVKKQLDTAIRSNDADFRRLFATDA